MIAGGVLDELKAVSALSGAAQSRNIPDDEAADVIQRAVAAGKECPRYVPVSAAEAAVDLSQFGCVFEPENGEEESTRWVLADPGPFPEELLYVPGLIGEVMEHNLETAYRRQPVLALAAAIALQAVLAGRKVRDERNNRTNLYIVAASESGTGKEHARQINSTALLLTKLEGPEDVASDTGLVSLLASRANILMQIDEFGKFLKSLATGGKTSPHIANITKLLLQLFTTASRTYRGKAYADIDRTLEIDQPNLVVYGTCVPGNFYESLTRESLEDGLLARMFIFEGDPKPKREKPLAKELPQSVIDAVIWWRDWTPGGGGLLSSVHPQPCVVETTEEASAVFNDLAEKIEAAMAEETGWERGIWARCEEKACKLALIWACSRDRESLRIDGDAARWACGLAWYLTRRLVWLGTQHVSDGQFDALQKRVMAKVEKNGGGITGRGFARAFHYLDRETRGRILANLLEVGMLVRREYGEGKKKGLEYVVPSKNGTVPGLFKQKD